MSSGLKESSFLPWGSWGSKDSENLDVPGRNLGSMVRINGLFHLPIPGLYRGYKL